MNLVSTISIIFSGKIVILIWGNKTHCCELFFNSKLLIMIVVQCFLPLIKYQIDAIKISKQTFAFENISMDHFNIVYLMCFAFH